MAPNFSTSLYSSLQVLLYALALHQIPSKRKVPSKNHHVVLTRKRYIPDLSGKVILVTGGNTCLGKETILQLSKHNPHQIFIGARNKAKADTAISEIKAAVSAAKITLLEMDISSFASIKRAVTFLASQTSHLDILINNAGIMGVNPSLTEDGYEMQFGTNHMSPALLTKLLMPLPKLTAKIPGAHLKHPSPNLSGRVRYGQSKLANIYFIKAVATRYPDITCVSLHPGLVQTNITTGAENRSVLMAWAFAFLKRFVMVDAKTGALGQVWAAMGKREELTSGAYYVPLKKEVKGNKQVDDGVLAEKLWERTEKEFLEQGF